MFGEDLGRQVVHLVGVPVAEVRRDVRLRDVRGARPRRVEERPAGPAHLVDDLLGQLDDAVAVGAVPVSVELDQPCPAAADAEDPVAFAQRRGR